MKHHPLIPREFTNMTDIRGLYFHESFWYFTIKYIYVKGSNWTNQGFLGDPVRIILRDEPFLVSRMVLSAALDHGE